MLQGCWLLRPVAAAAAAAPAGAPAVRALGHWRRHRLVAAKGSPQLRLPQCLCRRQVVQWNECVLKATEATSAWKRVHKYRMILEDRHDTRGERSARADSSNGQPRQMSTDTQVKRTQTPAATHSLTHLSNSAASCSLCCSSCRRRFLPSPLPSSLADP